MGEGKTIWMNAAAGAASQAGGIGLGMGMQRIGVNYDHRKQRKQQEKLMEIQMRGERQMMDYQQLKQLEMWEKTGYGAQMKQMKEAGLNPALMYGMGGGGGQSVGGTMPSVGGASASDPNTRGMGMQMGGGIMGTAMQLELLKAQKENIEADTRAKEAGIPKTGAETVGIGIENELKKLDLKVSEETLWERINEIVSRSIEQQEKGVIAGVNREVAEETKEANINRIKEEAMIPAVQKRLMEANITVAEGQVQKIAADIWKIAQDVQIAQGHLDIAKVQQQFETNWDNIIGKGAVSAIGGLIQALPFAGILKGATKQDRPPVIKGFGGKQPYK